MAIPKHSDLFRTVLIFLSDGKVHHWRECIDYVIRDRKLEPEEANLLLKSGRARVIDSRVQWAITYIRQAGLVSYVKRGYCQITDEGRRVLQDKSVDLTHSYLMRYDSFARFVMGGRGILPEERASMVSSSPLVGQDKLPDPQIATPEERMGDAFAELNRVLETEILDEILNKRDFKFFERLVVDLVLAMGYGSDEENAGVVTKASNDGGVDGVISEDKLGFNKIYIQAKCWDRGNTVSRPEIQKFVGALAGMGANKGLFITTSQYSKDAMEYAHNQHGAKVVLVDGIRLAKLMIEHGVGVSPVSQYVIKRIDSDYFNLN